MKTMIALFTSLLAASAGAHDLGPLTVAGKGVYVTKLFDELTYTSDQRMLFNGHACNHPAGGTQMTYRSGRLYAAIASDDCFHDRIFKDGFEIRDEWEDAQ